MSVQFRPKEHIALIYTMSRTIFRISFHPGVALLRRLPRVIDI